MESVCVAFKAHMGWVNAVAVAAASTAPECRDLRRVSLVDDADRETSEPYHVAGGWDGLTRIAPPPDPAAIIRRARGRQARSAQRALTDYREALRAAGYEWTRAVMLVGRGWLGHELEEILVSHAQVHVAEGEAIREAARSAFGSLGIPWIDQDEKSVLAAAAEALGVGDPDGRLKASRPAGARTWRLEERLLTLGAWLNRR